MEIHGSGKLKDPVKVQVFYGFIDDLSERHRTTGPEFREIKNFRFFILNIRGEKSTLELQMKEDHGKELSPLTARELTRFQA